MSHSTSKADSDIVDDMDTRPKIRTEIHEAPRFVVPPNMPPKRGFNFPVFFAILAIMAIIQFVLG